MCEAKKKREGDEWTTVRSRKMKAVRLNIKGFCCSEGRARQLVNATRIVKAKDDDQGRGFHDLIHCVDVGTSSQQDKGVMIHGAMNHSVKRSFHSLIHNARILASL
ncbi:hypothetical protein VNO78_19516 [Psophocarpus tetragonolobus]|uniref:Uncharacterized protein n=1 Tax=Psophocarpus tetragonolobus TaxID=3891 RepID=A0AAN9S893_PSOTE